MTTDEERDEQLLEAAIEESRRCVPSPGAYSVGAVIVTAGGDIFKGYSRESAPHNHAEEEAIAKARAAGARLDGAAIYSSMEPCTDRRSKPVSCTRLIIENGFGKVVYALAEPPYLARCNGQEQLEESGIHVVHIPRLGAKVEEINGHLIK